MSTYIPSSVLQIQQLHAPVIDHPNEFDQVGTQLEGFARLSFEAWQRGEELTLELVSNHHPHHLGKSREELAGEIFTQDDFMLMVAREHGFDAWEEVPADIYLSPPFEVGIDLMLMGHGEALKKHLQVFPHLVYQKSYYGHEATLLHYLASNGIEMRRQMVPKNLVEMMEILLEFGADKDARMKVYGGGFTSWELYSTGAHPYSAGIDERSVKALIA